MDTQPSQPTISRVLCGLRNRVGLGRVRADSTMQQETALESGTPGSSDRWAESLPPQPRPGRQLERKREVSQLLGQRGARLVDYRKMVWNWGGDLVIAIGTVSIGHQLHQSFSRDLTSVDANLLGGMNMIATGGLISRELGYLSQKIFHAWAKGDPDGEQRMRTVHEYLVRKYAGEKARMPENLSLAIDEEDANFAVSLRWSDLSSAREALYRRQGIYFSFPTKPYDVCCQQVGGDHGRGRQIDAAVSSLLGEYPQENRLTLSAFISQVRANSILQEPSRTSIYLEGPPGTGKTRFVFRLGESLGLPVHVVQSATKDGSELFSGQGLSNVGPAQKQVSSEESIIGKVPAAVISSGILNPIIFFDEFDSCLADSMARDLLRRCLAPSTKVINLSGLKGLALDVSRVTFVLAGNAPLTDDALVSRVKQVKFEGLERDSKLRAVEGAIAGELTQSYLLPAAAADALGDAVGGLAHRVLAKDIEMGIPGARIAIETAKEVVSSHRSALLAGRQLSEQDERVLVAQGFRQRLRSSSTAPTAAPDARAG